MKFICLGYIQEGKFENMPEAERNSMVDACFAYDDVLRKGGHFAGGEGLQGPRSAATLLVLLFIAASQRAGAQIFCQELAGARRQGHGRKDRVLLRTGGEDGGVRDDDVVRTEHAATLVDHAVFRRAMHAACTAVMNRSARRLNPKDFYLRRPAHRP